MRSCVAPIVGFCPLMAPRVGLGLFSTAVVDVVLTWECVFP